MNGDKRYHAEVKVTLEGREARINVFADTLAEIFQDIGTICSQFPQDWMNPAKREILNAERKAEQLRQDGHLPPKPSAKSTKSAVPVCTNCGSQEHMELIKWTDKNTGESRQAWKCQECKEWLRPNGR